jgi:hypothetical protein
MDARFIREPWCAVLPNEAQQLQRRLEEEIAPEHELRRRMTRVVARRVDNDDVLAELPDGSVVVVHLTWQEGGVPTCSSPQSAEMLLRCVSHA